MCGIHVFGRAWDGKVEVQLEAQYGAGDKHDEYGEGGVFEIGHLDLHRAELNAPADVGVGGRGFEANVLPVGRLQILEMVGFAEVELIEVFGEDYQGVADEEMGKVGGEKGIHAAGNEAGVDGGIDDELGIVVLRA